MLNVKMLKNWLQNTGNTPVRGQKKITQLRGLMSRKKWKFLKDKTKKRLRIFCLNV
jgi:hypothetical protein